MRAHGALPDKTDPNTAASNTSAVNTLISAVILMVLLKLRLSARRLPSGVEDQLRLA